jgi:hypothetical protein
MSSGWFKYMVEQGDLDAGVQERRKGRSSLKPMCISVKARWSPA